MNEQKKQKKGTWLKVLIGILAVLGVLFLILLIIPTDDEEDEDKAHETASVTQKEEEIKTEKPAVKTEKGSGRVPYADAAPVSVGTDAKSATVMVYMNGSDLETEAGEATRDISEMISSGIGENVNVIIQTMGTKKWQRYGISSKTAQTYRIAGRDIELIRDDLGQLDCTEADTLSEFIGFCKTEYPADRYLFLFWDHGGGPVYGFGYDEWQGDDESLTIAEMAKAFSDHSDIHFDIIGMDCCIMASVETCYALAPYCKYALLSEDFESGLGWSYKEWMRQLEENPGMSTPLLGKYIVDSIVEDNENSPEGDSSCLGLFNESTINSLFSAWKNYAYLNEDKLLNKNYSRVHKAKKRSAKGFWDFWGDDLSNVTLSDYYISDMLALIESVDSESEESDALKSALKACVAYYGHTSDKNELTGIAVSLPYGDSDFYKRLKSVYTEVGIDKEYIEWLGNFVSSSGYDDYYDYDDFEDGWGGWGAYEEDYGCSGNSCSNSWFYDDDGSCSSDFCDSDYCDYFDYDDEGSFDDWIYDYEDEVWYLYEDGYLYLYDDAEDMMYCYDEDTDEIYYFDDYDEEWYLCED